MVTYPPPPESNNPPKSSLKRLIGRIGGDKEGVASLIAAGAAVATLIFTVYANWFGPGSLNRARIDKELEFCRMAVGAVGALVVSIDDTSRSDSIKRSFRQFQSSDRYLLQLPAVDQLLVEVDTLITREHTLSSRFYDGVPAESDTLARKSKAYRRLRREIEDRAHRIGDHCVTLYGPRRRWAAVSSA